MPNIDIPEIGTNTIDIRDATIPEVRDWVVSPPTAVPAATPIVNQVGVVAHRGHPWMC